MAEKNFPSKKEKMKNTALCPTPRAFGVHILINILAL